MKHTPSVLVVDDNSTDALLIARAFEKSLSCSLNAVTSSIEALKYLQHEDPYSDPVSHPTPDLVTLDSKMPQSGKWDVLLWIRQQPELKNLPVVILCGSADPADEKLALDLGANAYHIKPQDFDEFLGVIDGIAQRWLKQ
jgi:CheY-like chemotaxis protein